MKLEPIVTTLRSALSARTLFEDTHGRVLVGARPVDLHPIVEAASATVEWMLFCDDGADREDGEAYPHVVLDALEEHFEVHPLLDFEWQGAMLGWWAKLVTITLGDDLEVVLWCQEERRLLAIAAFVPRTFPSGARVVLETFVSGNGRALGIDGIFGSLPSQTTNHRPDLIDRATVARAFGLWMAEAVADDRARWADVIKGAAGPQDLERYLDESYREEKPRKRRRRASAPAATMPPSEPPGVLGQRILERFDAICRERMPGDLRAWKALPRLDRLIYAIVLFDSQLQRNGPAFWIENGYATTHTKLVLAALKELDAVPAAADIVRELAELARIFPRLERQATALLMRGADDAEIDAHWAPLDARQAAVAAAWDGLRQPVLDALRAVAELELPPLFDAETVAWLEATLGQLCNERQRAVLAWLRRCEEPELDNARYRALTGVDARTARHDLRGLVTLGLLARDERGRRTSYALIEEEESF